MFLKAIITSAICLFMISVPAGAGWQYTEWGMTPEEVVKASNNTIGTEAHYDYKHYENIGKNLVGNYSAFNILFVVDAIFDNNDKLNSIKLALKNKAKCQLFLSHLVNTYGEGVVLVNNGLLLSTRSWRDEKNKNLVEFITSLETKNKDPLICDVTYKPLPMANQAGGL